MKVTSAKGVVLDMGAMMALNEKQRAIGAGHRMNARGDYLDEHGNVVAKHEDLVQDYYDASPNAVSQSVALNDLTDEVLTPLEAIDKLEKAQAAPADTGIKAEAPKKRSRRKLSTDDSED